MISITYRFYVVGVDYLLSDVVVVLLFCCDCVGLFKLGFG